VPSSPPPTTSSQLTWFVDGVLLFFVMGAVRIWNIFIVSCTRVVCQRLPTCCALVRCPTFNANIPRYLVSRFLRERSDWKLTSQQHDVGGNHHPQQSNLSQHGRNDETQRRRPPSIPANSQPDVLRAMARHLSQSDWETTYTDSTTHWRAKPCVTDGEQ
jgi:hypothetical protein